MRKIVKYLVKQKEFIAEHDTQKKKDLKNIRKAVTEFKRRLSIKVRRKKNQTWQKNKTLEEKSC